MGINVSQKTINKNIKAAKKSMTTSEKKDWKEGLKYADLNGDGKTTGIEMYKDWSNSCASVFKGNEAFLKRGEEIAIAQGELYSRYAGKDGKLNAYEYKAALQSDEMGALIDEYWEMKDIMEAQKKDENVSQKTINKNIKAAKKSMTKSEKKECKQGLKYADVNGDGKTTGVEMYINWSDTCASIFKGNEAFLKRGEEIAIAQGELYSRYAGKDGKLNAYEYEAALQSDEMGALIDEYWEMQDAMEAQKYNTASGLSRYDNNRDNKITVFEYIKNKLNLFKHIFKNEKPELQQDALNIVLKQSDIILKYAGDDGILSEEEYTQALRSESYGASMEEYLEIKQQLKSYIS